MKIRLIKSDLRDKTNVRVFVKQLLRQGLIKSTAMLVGMGWRPLKSEEVVV